MSVKLDLRKVPKVCSLIISEAIPRHRFYESNLPVVPSSTVGMQCDIRCRQPSKTEFRLKKKLLDENYISNFSLARKSEQNEKKLCTVIRNG
jgi:hypothetical protein